MNKIRRYFELARKVAEKGDSNGIKRQYRLGAIGVRTDGATVCASNISSRAPHPRAHAEARLTRKLDVGSIVYVVRITRAGLLTSARPCGACRQIMLQRGIARCYYSVSEDEYGVIHYDG
jgi:tRNA(Arg) A34 adenosine deaminase TadA